MVPLEKSKNALDLLRGETNKPIEGYNEDKNEWKRYDEGCFAFRTTMRKVPRGGT